MLRYNQGVSGAEMERGGGRQMPEVALFRGCPPGWAEAKLEKGPKPLRTDHTRVGLWEADVSRSISGAFRSKGPGGRQETPVCPHSVYDSDPSKLHHHHYSL